MLFGRGEEVVTFKSILIRGLAKRALSSTATIRHTLSEGNLDLVTLGTGKHNTKTHRLDSLSC